MPRCFWSDDSTLEVYLTMLTDAAPGMTVGIKPGIIWPKLWTYPAACGANPCGCALIPEEDDMCAPALSLAVDKDDPCDRRDTEEIERCIQAVALIQALDEC